MRDRESLEVLVIARNHAGEISVVSVGGRTFVHGSMLDRAYARRAAYESFLHRAVNYLALHHDIDARNLSDEIDSSMTRWAGDY